MSNNPEVKTAFQNSKIKVLVVDDHPIIRQGLSLLFSQKNDMEVCGEADNVETALEQITVLKPDIVIVDISLKDSNGLDLIKQIKIKKKNLPVLVLSVHDESIYAERALRAGARGYIMKEELTDNVVIAIRQIISGKLYLSNQMSEKMLDKLVKPSPGISESSVEILSDRELEVFRLFGLGMSTKEIADKIHVSPKTVQSYRVRIKDKMNIEKTSELLKHAIQWASKE